MSGPELPATAREVRVSVRGRSRGWAGARMHPPRAQPGPPSPRGQGSFIRDSAQLGGFEPDWATTPGNSPNYEQRDRDPGKPPDSSHQRRNNQWICKIPQTSWQAALRSWSWKERGLRRQRSWVQIPVWPLSSCVASGKLLNSLPHSVCLM